jgi:hypothetical protein
MQMKRLILALGFAVVLVSSVAFAAKREDVDLNKWSIQGVQVTATAAELNKVDGLGATVSELNAAADLSSRVTTATVTNGSAITLSASTPVVVITSRGAASGSTNTVTIATPYPLYQEFTLIVAAASTNRVLLADNSTVMALGSSANMAATGTLKIFTLATNSAVKVSGPSAN